MDQSFPQRNYPGDDRSGEPPRTELQKRIEGGESPRTILAEIYSETQGWLYRLAYRWLRDAGDAEDFVQEMFLKMNRSFDTLIAREPVPPWIHRVARNELTSLYRKRIARGGGRDRPLEAEEVQRELERELYRQARTPGAEQVETWVGSFEPVRAYLRTLVARGTLSTQQLDDYWYEVAEGVTQQELADEAGLTQGRIAQRKGKVGRQVRLSMYLCEILGLVRTPHQEAEIRSHLDLFDLTLSLTAEHRELLSRAGGAVRRDSAGLPVLYPEDAEAAIQPRRGGRAVTLGELHDAESRYAAAIPNPAPRCVATPCAQHTAPRS
jgi:RNA polymerase sigma factor (sigma-70 family)